MKFIQTTAVSLFVLAGAAAMAAAPKLHTTKTVALDAPADKVWATVKDFDRLNAWHPAVAKDEIVEGVLPVSDYTSTFTVKSTGKNKSTATWSGSYKRKNTADNPGEKENDKTATDTIAAVYQGGLDNLKKLVEAK